MDATGEVAGQMWDEVNPNRIADSWAEQIPELTSVVSGAQLGAARQADPYITAALDAEDVGSDAVSAIDPTAFSGSASDGRGLIGLLSNPVVVTLLSIQDGMDVTRALLHGKANLDMLVRTQVADAGRAADQVSLTARPKAKGYVRVAVGNSCARCLILAGKVYDWNTGFQRHPRCDCIHLPTGTRLRVPFQDPKRIYDRMTEAQRIRAGFTRADQKAIALGADLNQVVNAHRGLYTAGGHRFTTEGTTRRGFARSRLGRGSARITPDEIFRAAGDDRDEALRLLYRHGYLVEEPVTAARAVDVLAIEPAAGAAGADRLPLPTVQVRPSLARARSIPDLEKAFKTEARRITGRRIDFDLGDAVNPDNAKEIAEGTLRLLDEFPDTQLGVSVGRMTTKATAETDTATGLIRLDPDFMESRSYWTRRYNDAEQTAFHRRSMFTPAGTGAHEGTHAMMFQYDPLGTRRKVSRLIDDLAGRENLDLATYVHRELGGYALQHMDELVAQGVADALISPNPSPLSTGILRILREQYRAGRMQVDRALLPQLPDLGGLTVPQLRELAKTRGIVGYSKMSKPQLLERLSPADDAAIMRPAGAKSLPAGQHSWAGHDGIDVTDKVEREFRTYSLTKQAQILDQIRTGERNAFGGTRFTTRFGTLPDRSVIVSPRREAEIRSAIEAMAPDGKWVTLKQVREGLAGRFDRTEVDNVLQKLNRSGDWHVVPESNQKTLTPRDWLAAVTIGGQDKHALRVLRRGPELPAPPPPRPTAAARAAETAAKRRQTIVDQRRAVSDALADVDELLANGATPRALTARAQAMRNLAGSGEAGKTLGPLFDAMETGDAAAIRAAADTARTQAKLTQVGGRSGDLATFDPRTMQGLADEAIPAGSQVIVVRPGHATTVGRERVTVTKATATRASDAEIAAAQRRATRAAARERNRVIESSRGSARLLAEVDELLAKKADLAVIRQRLDPALIGPEQIFAGADRAILDALRKAVDSGDVTKVRAAVTQASTKATLKPISRSGAKVKFDPDLMEAVGDEIPAGAKVVVIRRGTTLPGLTEPLQRARVRLDVPALKYDARAARVYTPRPDVVRKAEIIDRPSGTVSEVVAPDGEVMRFDGPYALVEEPGRPGQHYGVALDEWRATYSQVPGKPGSWVKTAEVKAYRHTGEPRLVTTTIDGKVERVNVAHEGDWIVRNPGGEIQVVADEQFQRLYAASDAMGRQEFDQGVRGAAKGRAALKEAPAGMSGTYTNDYRFPGLDVDSPEYRRARMTMRYYYGEGYSVQNGMLRHADARWRPPHQSSLYAGEDPVDHIRRLDRLFDSSRLTHDVVAYRGLGTGRSVFGDPASWPADLTGFKFVDPAYASTTVRREVATAFSQDGGVQARLFLPRGTKAIQISDFGEEAELLLPRGTTFRVVHDRGFSVVIKDGKKIRIRNIDVEVIVPDRTPPLPWEGTADAATPRAAKVTGGSSGQGSYASRQQRLDEAVQKVQTEPVRPLGGGETADVNLETYGQDKVVRKTYGRRVPHYSRADVGRDADAEILAPKVIEAFGVQSWATSRVGRDEIVGEFIEGETFIDKVGYATIWGDDAALARAAAPYVDSPAGRRLGLADYIMGNSDRNAGNWIITPDGRIVAIDNGAAFSALKGTEVPAAGLFSDVLTQRGPGGFPNGDLIDVIQGISRAELAAIRGRLQELRPDFVAAGRVSWFNAMMRRLREIEKRLA